MEHIKDILNRIRGNTVIVPTCTYCTLADIIPPRPVAGRTQLGTPICRECADIMVLDVYDFLEDEDDSNQHRTQEDQAA